MSIISRHEINFDQFHSDKVNGESPAYSKGNLSVNDAKFLDRQDHGVVRHEMPRTELPAIDFTALSLLDTSLTLVEPVAESLPATPKEPRHLAKAKFGYGVVKAVKGLGK